VSFYVFPWSKLSLCQELQAETPDTSNSGNKFKKWLSSLDSVSALGHRYQISKPSTCACTCLDYELFNFFIYVQVCVSSSFHMFHRALSRKAKCTRPPMMLCLLRFRAELRESTIPWEIWKLMEIAYLWVTQLLLLVCSCYGSILCQLRSQSRHHERSWELWRAGS